MSVELDTDANGAIDVSKGGTNATTLTDHGILLGSGTAAVTPMAAMTNGQLPIGSTGNDPVAAALTAGAKIQITNAAGSITVAATGAAASDANSDITSIDGLTTPLFHAILSAVQSNVTGDGTNYNITGAIWTEITDRGNNFSNGTVTAPSTKSYLLTGVILFTGVAAGHTQFDTRLITSNRSYVLAQINPGVIQISGNFTWPFSVIVDMDAADTVYLQVVVSGSTKVVDIYGDGSTGYTVFSGYLLP